MAVVKMNLFSAEKVSAEKSRFISRYAGGRPQGRKKAENPCK